MTVNDLSGAELAFKYENVEDKRKVTAKDVHLGVINQQMGFETFYHLSRCSLSLNPANLIFPHLSWFYFHTSFLVSPKVIIISHLNRSKSPLQSQFCPLENHSPPCSQGWLCYFAGALLPKYQNWVSSDSNPQPFWNQEKVLWKANVSQTRKGELVLGWFQCITFTGHFISIIMTL